VGGVKVAVIGCGYWGPNLVRTLVELPGVEVQAVVDCDPIRLEHARARYPQIEVFGEDYTDLFALDLDAVAVCTPAETHFEIARACLEAGLDVFVEKPLATSVTDAQHLAELADTLGRVLMVGHIGAYNPAVGALRDMVRRGVLGEVAYIDAVRVGLGLFHPTLNVVWDLAPHDVAIFMYLLGEAPTSVSTRGIACVESSIEDVAYMTLTFPSGVLAHARMSWMDPCKTRRITVVGKEKMVVYDDLENHEKLRIHDKSVEAIRRTDSFGEFQFAYHYGSIVSPYVHFDEPLRLECLHFVDCVSGRACPRTDGENGLAVVKVIEAAQQSLKAGGAQVSIPTTAGNGAATSGRTLAAV
jgi:predicted dehydrogenase